MTSSRLARAMLGRENVITHGEIAEHYQELYTVEGAVQQMSRYPCTEELQRCCKKNMILVAGPPATLSLGEVIALTPTLFGTDDHGMIIKKYSFASELVLPNWIALQKHPVIDSFMRTWPEQQGMVPEPDRILNIAEIAWVMAAASRVRDLQLYSGHFVRSISMAAFRHVYIGHREDTKLIDIHFYGNDDRFPGVGVAAGRVY